MLPIYRKKNHFPRLSILTAVVLSLAPVTFAQEVSQAGYDELIQAARNGKYDAALVTLPKLIKKQPKESKYLFDYVVVLCWSNKWDSAKKYLDQLALINTPNYVYHALIDAAIRAQDKTTYDSIARITQEKFPNEKIKVYTIKENTNQEDLEYTAKLTKAKQGDAQPALEMLHARIAKYPNTNRFKYDLIAVLVLNKNFAEALVAFQQAGEITNFPPYVLDSGLTAARAQKSWNDVEAILNEQLRRNPKRIYDVVELRSYMLLEQNKHTEAYQVLAPYVLQGAKKNKTPVQILRALGHWQIQQKDYFSALVSLTDALAQIPDNAYLKREVIFLSSKMGNAHWAKMQADKSPEIFSQTQLAELLHDWSSEAVRWGEAWSLMDSTKQRFVFTDQALEKNTQALSHQSKLPEGEFLRTLVDRMLALRQRERMQEVLEIYQKLLARYQKAQIPALADALAGDANLGLRQPKLAVENYLSAIQKANKDANPEWEFSLFYAYIESENFSAAKQLVDQLLLKHQRPHRFVGEGLNLPANSYYERAKTTEVNYASNANKLGVAEKKVDDLLAIAPFNPGIREMKASILAAREQPGLAARQFIDILQDDPNFEQARISYTDTLITLREYAKAREQITILEQYKDANSPQLIRLKRRLQQALSGEFVFEYGYTQSRESNAAKSSFYSDHDTNWRSGIYSPWMRDHWRVFSEIESQRAVLENLPDARRQLLMGVAYRDPSWDARLAATRDLTMAKGTGIDLRLNYIQSDHWMFGGGIQTRTMDLPIKAAANGFYARKYELYGTYILNESLSAGLNTAYWDISDGNKRQSFGAFMANRLYAGPMYLLNSKISASIGRNSKEDALYFNPRRDRSLNLSLDNQWITWRHYDTKFIQKLALDVGQYWQKDIGSKATYAVRYEHEWDGMRLSPTVESSLRYGIGWSRRSYDGNPNTARSAYISFNLHF